MKKLFIAVTGYDGKVSSICADSLLKSNYYLHEKGIQACTYFHDGDCYISRARNICSEIFLETDCTDLIFIDWDVGFPKDAIFKLLKHDKECVSGAYPYRTDENFTKFKFPIRLNFDRPGKDCRDKETGLVSAVSATTGFMRIQRSVFKKLIDSGTVKIDNDGIYIFFENGMVIPGEPKWYGEDNYFCKKWRAIGGELWIEPDINFVHLGNKKYTGNLHNYLSNQFLNQCEGMMPCV